MKKYMCDFETTTDIQDCRVWLWCAVNLADLNERHYGYDIKSFFDLISNGSYTCYFHNLKFDGQFILWYAMHELNMTYSDDREPGTLNTLINDSGVFYKIELIFSRKNRHTNRVVFLDSFKKLAFKVRDIAKAYGLEETKGEIDYTKARPVGYIPDDNEMEYVTNDVIIVAKALNILFAQGLTKMTQSSDGLAYCQQLLTKKGWDHYFPVLDIAIDDDIRQSYKGGVVMVRPGLEGKEVYNGHSFDKNSMYPWAMTQTMPWGVPLWFTGKYESNEQYPLYIQRLSCEFKVKKGFLPTIQLKHNPNYIQTQYIQESEEQTMLWLTSIDLKLFFDHYEVYNIRWEGGWMFKAVDGIFDKYVNHWYDIKKNSEGAMRSVAKLMLNAFYGKTAARTHIKSKTPYLGDDEIIHYTITEEKIKDPVYTAVASFITSYGRDSVIRTAQALGGSREDSHFCYMDTDSVHVIGISVEEASKIIEVDAHKLGAWKHEYSFDRAKYIRQKCYIEEIAYKKGAVDYEKYVQKMSTLSPEQQKAKKFELGQEAYYEYVKKCAGMTDSIKDIITYDEFGLGYEETSGLKLRPQMVKGGVVLVPTTFSMKA